ncbi:MAG: PIN domain-containing protein, partial [Steroidobacteraceae bacterium]
ILIYAHDRDAGEKRERAARTLEGLWNDRNGRLSVQVLQEFYVTVTQRLATAQAAAREVMRTYAPWVQQQTTPATVLRATEIGELAKISFWDALIVAAAEQAGATEIYTEDLNAGQTIVGVRIVNPLA